MLEIKVLVSEVDYDGLADVLLPKLAEALAEKGGLWRLAEKGEKPLSAAAHKLIARKTPEELDGLVAELAEKKKALLLEKAAELLEKNSVSAQLCDISVTKV